MREFDLFDEKAMETARWWQQLPTTSDMATRLHSQQDVGKKAIMQAERANRAAREGFGKSTKRGQSRLLPFL